MDPNPHTESKITACNLAIGTGVFSPMRHSVLHMYNTSQQKLLAQFRWSVFNGDLLQATRQALPLMLIFQHDDKRQRNLN